MPFADTGTNLTFRLDAEPEVQFVHTPDLTTTDLIYNATVFSKDGLVNTAHQLLVLTATENNSVVIFDYALYTYV